MNISINTSATNTNYKKKIRNELQKTQEANLNTDINLNVDPRANINKANIAFGALKKSNFSGIDLLVVNQLKAPIQNFNSNEDFQNYCQEILNEKYLGKEKIKEISKSINEQTETQKRCILTDWIDYITNENKAYSPSIQLMILSSITKNLKEDTNHLPPILNKRKLADTIYEINKKSQENKNYTCNFDKIYRANLMGEIFQKERSIDENLNGWVRIPSKYDDPENFEKNVEKLQILSCDTWCTKTYNAEPYLAEGDFFIYFESGKPKVGIRTEGNYIGEIQGEKNDSVVPFIYIDEIKKCIKENLLDADNITEYNLKNAENRKKGYEKFAEKYGDVRKTKEYEKIFDFFGIKAEKNENGLLTVDKFVFEKTPEKPYSLDDLAVSEQELLEQIEEIKNDAYFKENIVSLGNLKSVGGNIGFKDASNLLILGNLEKVGGNVDLRGTSISIKEILNLEDIGRFVIGAEGKPQIKHPRLLLKSTPLSRPLTLKEYSYRAKYKLNTKKDVEAFIKLLNKGVNMDEAAYEAQFAELWE